MSEFSSVEVHLSSSSPPRQSILVVKEVVFLYLGIRQHAKTHVNVKHKRANYDDATLYTTIIKIEQ